MDKKTPYNQLNGIDQISSITTMMQQAYFRRSKQLPANLAAMAEMLKGDILKYLGNIPVGVLDEAITTSTLGDTDVPLSVSFFFNAAKKVWWQPKTNNHQWDSKDEDLAYWRDRVQYLQRIGSTDTEDYRHACEMMEHYSHHETEQDTINLLDTCAAMLKQMDDAKAQGKAVAKVGILNSVRIALPAFDTRREYGYLILRGQLDADAATNFTKDSVVEVNIDRMETGHHRLSKEEAEKSPEVSAKAMRLAVLDWLRSCNTRNTTPSAILIPLADENSYQRYRRTKA